MWILLLSLATGKGVAMDHVVFQSEALCQRAAQTWVKENNSSFRSISSICVKGE